MRTPRLFARCARRTALGMALLGTTTVALAAEPPIVLRTQGSFTAGGTVITAPGTHDPYDPLSPPDGQTYHGDHAYVQYQIPLNPRDLPIVMWHGGGQFSKTWESTPDGRDGFQNIFIRRGFSTYIVDQPRRGRAGRSTVSATINPVPNEQGLFTTFRLGVWPDYFDTVQFPRDPESLEQYYEQQTPNIGPGGSDLVSDGLSAVFDRVGPANLLTHSASGAPGWLTRIKNDNVKSIVAYEPAGYIWPEGDKPPALNTHYDNQPFDPGDTVSEAEFMELTKIPIQIIYGDFIPEEPSLLPGPERWRIRLIYAQQFVDRINARGGNAELLHLPDIGVYGNTHFPFSDLNNVEIANLLSDYYRRQGLDRRTH